MKYLDLKYLDTLNTPRLLNYYKKTIRKIRRFQNSLFCSCCGMPSYQIDGKLYTKEENKKRKEEFETSLNDSEKYLESIKLLLNNREHVQKNN